MTILRSPPPLFLSLSLLFPPLCLSRLSLSLLILVVLLLELYHCFDRTHDSDKAPTGQKCNLSKATTEHVTFTMLLQEKLDLTVLQQNT